MPSFLRYGAVFAALAGQTLAGIDNWLSPEYEP